MRSLTPSEWMHVCGAEKSAKEEYSSAEVISLSFIATAMPLGITRGTKDRSIQSGLVGGTICGLMAVLVCWGLLTAIESQSRNF